MAENVCTQTILEQFTLSPKTVLKGDPQNAVLDLMLFQIFINSCYEEAERMFYFVNDTKEEWPSSMLDVNIVEN